MLAVFIYHLVLKSALPIEILSITPKCRQRSFCPYYVNTTFRHQNCILETTKRYYYFSREFILVNYYVV